MKPALKPALSLEFTSRILKTGRRGRPRLEPHRMVMLRMNRRIHSAMRTYCVQNDVSQREFIEMAAEMQIINSELARRIKARRKAMEVANVCG